MPSSRSLPVAIQKMQTPHTHNNIHWVAGVGRQCHLHHDHKVDNGNHSGDDNDCFFYYK